MSKYDAGNESQVKKRKTKAQLREEREVEELRQLLSTEENRACVWRWLEKCKIYSSSFTGNSQTFFNEGMREIGLQMIVDIDKADPTAYTKMRTEAMKREEDNG